MRNCTGRCVAVPTVAVPAAKKRFTGVAPGRLQFKLQKTHGALEGSVQQFTVNMKEAKSLSTLEGYSCFQTSNDGFPAMHYAYKFQIAVDVVFHKAVDPAVVIQPPVTLTLEVVDVYADAAPLNDANCQLLNFIEVYEQNGSDWGFFQTLFPYNLFIYLFTLYLPSAFTFSHIENGLFMPNHQ